MSDYSIDNGAISLEDEFIGHGDYACMMRMSALEKEVQELREFKESTNMMVRRTLNHTCSDYEAIMAIDEKLIGEKK